MFLEARYVRTRLVETYGWTGAKVVRA
jgi:hypothetical protein